MISVSLLMQNDSVLEEVWGENIRQRLCVCVCVCVCVCAVSYTHLTLPTNIGV